VWKQAGEGYTVGDGSKRFPKRDIFLFDFRSLAESEWLPGYLPNHAETKGKGRKLFRVNRG
jgi:hypothetical protein